MAVIKKRFPVPERLATRLRRETDLIVRHARTGETWALGTPPRDRLARRLEILKEAGLFYPGFSDTRQITYADLMAAQAEVARLHGLAYEGERTDAGWTTLPAPAADDELHGRSRGYLSDLFRADVNKGIPKVDLALLAHAFQTPVAVLEAPHDGTVEQYVDWVLDDADLFARGTAFLEAVADPAHHPVVMTIDDWHRLAHEQAAEARRKGVLLIDMRAPPRPVPAGRSLVLTAKVDSKLADRRFTALALAARENEAPSLITTAPLTDDNLGYEGRQVIVPPLSVLEDAQVGWGFDQAGRYTVHLVAAAFPLDELALYRRTRRNSELDASGHLELADADLEELRNTLLRNPPDDWCVVRGSVEVVGD